MLSASLGNFLGDLMASSHLAVPLACKPSYYTYPHLAQARKQELLPPCFEIGEFETIL